MFLAVQVYARTARSFYGRKKRHPESLTGCRIILNVLLYTAVEEESVGEGEIDEQGADIDER